MGRPRTTAVSSSLYPFSLHFTILRKFNARQLRYGGLDGFVDSFCG